MTHAYIIKDADGYWCGLKRGADRKPVHFFSSKRKDAARLHFYESAQHFARMLPQPTKIVRVADRNSTVTGEKK
jgi:hypothetical protein